jgi:hypothetical protein
VLVVDVAGCFCGSAILTLARGLLGETTFADSTIENFIFGGIEA